MLFRSVNRVGCIGTLNLVQPILPQSLPDMLQQGILSNYLRVVIRDKVQVYDGSLR